MLVEENKLNMPHIYRQLLYYESFVYIFGDRVVPSLSRETFTRNKSFIYLSVIIVYEEGNNGILHRDQTEY